jgi:hypothetical protein
VQESPIFLNGQLQTSQWRWLVWNDHKIIGEIKVMGNYTPRKDKIMNVLATNERIIKKRRLMASTLLAIAIAMCIAPSVAYARSNSFTGANSRIYIFSGRQANNRPSASAQIRTLNNKSNGIRCRVIVTGRMNGTNFTHTGAWRTYTAEGARLLANNVRVSTPNLVSPATTGNFTAEGQRRASASAAWTASGTIRTSVSW